ncbi:MAG: hypothetical protein P8M22_08965 [Phycisphaerales bacterium]|nr:hypothetical protein [Phycisphaerales bacterium]
MFDLKVVGNGILVAIRLAVVRVRVAVDIIGVTQEDLDGIWRSISVAVVLAVIRDAIIVDIGGGAIEYVLLVGDTVGIAVVAGVPEECPAVVCPVAVDGVWNIAADDGVGQDAVGC